MRLPIYQIDAFTTAVFSGNPAAVVPLPSWLPDPLLQSIAAENNLAETAFFVPVGDRFELRWFTPTVEVDLCGHATLATAFVIANWIEPSRSCFPFETRQAGLLTVDRVGAEFTLDFPSRPAVAVAVDPALVPALGGPPPQEILAARDYLVVYQDAAAVRALAPDFVRLAGVDRFGVIATAPGDQPGVDFVSRFFAPAQGIPEDPVTGSSHCTLTPYWAFRLGRTQLSARQLSSRGGAMTCAVAGDRVRLTGQAVLYLEGTLNV